MRLIFFPAEVDLSLALVIAVVVVCALYLNFYFAKLNSEAMQDLRNGRWRDGGMRFVVQRRASQLFSEKLHSRDLGTIIAVVCFILFFFTSAILIVKLGTR
jgi:hypothetical protein